MKCTPCPGILSVEVPVWLKYSSLSLFDRQGQTRRRIIADDNHASLVPLQAGSGLNVWRGHSLRSFDSSSAIPSLCAMSTYSLPTSNLLIAHSNLIIPTVNFSVLTSVNGILEFSSSEASSYPSTPIQRI